METCGYYDNDYLEFGDRKLEHACGDSGMICEDGNPDCVPAEACSDGTAKEACSVNTLGVYCNSDLELVPDCGGSCPCSSGSCNAVTGFCDDVGELYVCSNDVLNTEGGACYTCDEKYSFMTWDYAVYLSYSEVPGRAGTSNDKWYYWANNQFNFVSQTSDTTPADARGNCISPVRGIATRFGSGVTPSLKELSQSYGGPAGLWKVELYFKENKIGERTFEIN